MTLDARHLKVLRRLRDLGGWQYADSIAAGGDGRTVAPVLVALHRAGLVTCADGERRSPHSSRITWTLTADGMAAASDGPARQESRLVAIGPCGCIRIALVLTATTSRADVKSLRRRAKLRGYTVRGMAASEIASARWGCPACESKR